MGDTDQGGEASAARPLNGGVVPYLMLEGADRAIEFYGRAFGATPIGERARLEDGRIRALLGSQDTRALMRLSDHTGKAAVQETCKTSTAAQRRREGVRKASRTG